MSNRIMDSYGTEDFVIPQIKLIQSVGGEDAKAEGASPGDFFCPITGEVINGEKGFDITVVDIPKKRTYWGRSDISDDPPVCSSTDGKTSQSGDNCDQCPYNARCDTPWLLTAQDRRDKCLMHYNIHAIKDSIPVMIRASGISTTPVRELMTHLFFNKEVKGEYHRVLVHVTSQKKKTASGEAFCMQMRASRLVEDAEKLLELKSMSDQILGMPLLPESEPERQAEEIEAPEPARLSAPIAYRIPAPLPAAQTPGEAQRSAAQTPGEAQRSAAQTPVPEKTKTSPEPVKKAEPRKMNIDF